MTRGVRSVLALAALAVLGGVLVAAVTGLEPFGHYPGPYGDAIARVVPDARHTGQLVAATVFDVRGFDTLGEEMILFAAACGCAALLRRRRRLARDAAGQADGGGTRARGAPARPRPSFAVGPLGAALVGPMTVLGAYVILHGHLTPGGGFSGGVIVAGALLGAYAAGQVVRLGPVREVPLLEGAEALGAGGFLALALGMLVASGALLQNVLPLGTTGSLLSAGTIPVGNIAVGVEVAGAIALVLAEFVEQALAEEPE